MSGIYIHVPYCKHKCEYCDFYSVVTTEGKEKFVGLIEKELLLREDYLPDNEIQTIYFGGGTPSMLEANQIYDILNAISKGYSISKEVEITLEANPDDLNPELLLSLYSIGVNRMSIGIQSFSDNDLKQLGRRHNASQAVNAVKMTYNAGFDNISIDLIYCLPYSNTDIWISNLQKAFELPVKHLSCYHLIYEDGTPLSKRVAMGKVTPVTEDLSVEQFQILQEMSAQNGFIHYEISNLAKEGYFSRHNSSYWNQVPYLGLGPSAHSYNRSSRDWNPKSIALWKKSIEEGTLAAEREVLTSRDKINEYLITSLRTIWGVNIDFIAQNFGEDKATNFKKTAEKFIKQKIIVQSNGVFRILPKHYITSDGIISDFLEI